MINTGETLDELIHTDKFDLDFVEIAHLSCFTE